jgi:hypothetical protein
MRNLDLQDYKYSTLSVCRKGSGLRTLDSTMTFGIRLSRYGFSEKDILRSVKLL